MAVKRGGLGKGLEALLSVQNQIEEEHKSSTEISLDDIRPNPHQPRIQFDEQELEELKNSILEFGLIQPVIVRKVDKGYELVAGERRYRACKMAKMKKIPAIIREINDEEQAKMALVENLQRKDLNVVEEATGYQKLIDQYSLTQKELSDSIGKSRTYVTNTLRLLGLPSEVIEMLANGKLSAGHGKALLMFDESKQSTMAKLTIDKGLSVRTLEALVKSKTVDFRTKGKSEKDLHVIELEQRLTEQLGTKVTIKPGKIKSTLEITFYKDTDLNKILKKLL